MGECEVQEGIRKELCSTGRFEQDSVVIADWIVYDVPIGFAPFALVRVADTFTARQDVHAEQTTWEIPVSLVVEFTDWPASMLELRDLRQAVVDHFNQEGSQRSLGRANTTIDVIRAGGPIVANYAAYQGVEPQPDALPQYLEQLVIFEVREGL